MQAHEVEHKGIISAVKNDSLQVSLLTVSGCSTCAVKSSCGVAGAEAKMVDVPFQEGYQVGQEVHVRFKQAQGFKALFFGYLLPFLLVFVTLIAAISSGMEEGSAGLLSLGVLLPYYGSLYYLKDKIKEGFHYQLRKA